MGTQPVDIVSLLVPSADEPRRYLLVEYPGRGLWMPYKSLDSTSDFSANTSSTDALAAGEINGLNGPSGLNGLSGPTGLGGPGQLSGGHDGQSAANGNGHDGQSSPNVLGVTSAGAYVLPPMLQTEVDRLLHCVCSYFYLKC